MPSFHAIMSHVWHHLCPMPPIHAEDLKMAMQMAHLLSTRSRADRVHMGCVIINARTRNMVSQGYNHTIPHDESIMDDHGAPLLHVIHAEDDALQKLPFWATYACHALMTHAPCLSCAQKMHHRGIHHVYYVHNYHDASGITWLRSHGHEVKRLMLI